MSGSLISHQYVENSPGSQEKNGSSSSQEKDYYSVNPNQKVYDMPHQLDHEVNVVKIYFAEQKPKMKWENKEEPYTVQSVNGATAKAIKDKKEGDLKKLKKEIKNIQVLDSADDTKMISDSTKLKKGESVKLKWEENVHQKEADGKPAFEYSQVNKTSLKKKVWVVANIQGTAGKLIIQIFENELTNSEPVYDNPIKFLIGEEEKDKVEFKIDGRMEYHQEITLRPKSDEDLKNLIKNFNKREDENAFLYIKSEVIGTSDEIIFPDDTHEFLNKDGERLEIGNCICNDWEAIQSVIPAEKFQGYKTDCHAATHAQLKVMGYKEGFPRYQIAKAVRDKNNKFVRLDYFKDEFIKGTEYIKKSIKDGIPVTVGVDNHEEITPGNPDLTTDHFVVIVGMGTDITGSYFLFYDNADSSIGTSSENKLYCKCKENRLEGHADPASSYSTYTDRNTGTPVVLTYTVTSIRTSIKM